MSKSLFSFLLFYFFLAIGNTLDAQSPTTFTRASDEEMVVRDWMIDHLFSITDIMVTDVTSPPGAARFYGYSLLAAYMVYSETGNFNEDSLLQHLKNPIPKPELPLTFEKENINRAFSSTYAMLEVGKNIMPSGQRLTDAQDKLIQQYLKSKLIKKKRLKPNIKFAEKIASIVLTYANADGYQKLSTLKRYSPSNNPGSWYPTPPAYMAAIDPEWKTIEPFFLENIVEFNPPAPAVYSEEKSSSFYKQLSEIYEVTSKLTEEQKLIANFWDCNPFNVSYSGHMAIGLKKISPGGHWIGITGIACKKAELALKESLYIHTLVAMGLHDAFISCWGEKYRSDRIRPITAINQLIDETWRPILQTPPFPEYTSGHSVISKASAVLLTSYFGDDYDFIDTSEVFFGLPERAFDSFLKASNEAAISRLYGGIHFRDAIEVGMKQGENIARYILNKTGTHENLLSNNTNNVTGKTIGH
jgi:hypothetical protein